MGGHAGDGSRMWCECASPGGMVASFSRASRGSARSTTGSVPCPSGRVSRRVCLGLTWPWARGLGAFHVGFCGPRGREGSAPSTWASVGRVRLHAVGRGVARRILRVKEKAPRPSGPRSARLTPSRPWRSAPYGEVAGPVPTRGCGETHPPPLRGRGAEGFVSILQSTTVC